MTDDMKYSNLDIASDIVETEALAWVAQLNGDDVSEKDLATFREWVNRSPAHAAEMQELSHIWESLNVLTSMDESIRAADKVSKQLRKEVVRKSWMKRLALPSLITIAVVASFVVVLNIDGTVQNEQIAETAIVTVPIVFKSKIGEQQKHILTDGSIITLNTNSHIEVDFQDKQRSIRLLKGEAFFSVTYDPLRPFLVFANNGIVRAVGTQFSVHLKETGIDVLVSEGSVELSTLSPTKPSSQSSVLPERLASLGVIKAGHSAVIQNSKASIELVSTDKIDAELSWQNGLLTFTGEPLEEVIAEVSRYTDMDIVFQDPQLKNLRLGGVFKSGETDVLFRTLEANFGIRVVATKDQQVTLISQR